MEFDKNGKMISENKFPDFSKNKRADILTDICTALSVVKTDERFSKKEIDVVELEYLDDVNSFCWLVSEKLKLKCGTSQYSQDIYFINANTNKLEVFTKRNGVMTVDCVKIGR
ncbi:MAG: hypothetical protein JSU09_07685 [Bacteroidetes bacterium]|nr:hypothetical protein [Bacteroidota bacterium]